ncbi:autotransporter outer membrane beta-barrel domain-containing protein [Pseudomonas plecoglossicida]|uniref:autotransporter outer membrane beta-barrel domain-containing protein n=1 Tax=Pseudomonas plecoglossicida TaxID=70775 RepID=UPI000343DA13|nr:autotransporter outer membrane beta-barrel domain-containing protein [Pseudomonas plecoglossicida]EPB97813.1 adhesin autotransporter [Pseudomonas plecoglossicida NB2011]
MSHHHSTRRSSPRFERTRLAQALGLLFAGLFSLQPIEGWAADAGTVPLAFPGLLLGAPAPLVVNTADGIGILTTGAHDEASVLLAAARATGVLAQAGGVIGFDHASVASSATTFANGNGQSGLVARDLGRLSGTDVTVSLVPKATNGTAVTASNLTGVRAAEGGQVTLHDATVTMGGGVNGQTNQGLVAIGNGSNIEFSGGSITTQSKGSVAALAQDGGSLQLGQGTQISVTGAGSATTASHALKATGAGSRIVASDIVVNSSAVSASGARAEEGGHIQLQRVDFTSTGAATATTSTSVLHALNGASILADAVQAKATGNYVGGVRADGSGSLVRLSDSSLDIAGAGSAAANNAAARASNGAGLVIEGSRVSSQGTYDHGISVEGSGTRADVSGSQIGVGGARAHGVQVNSGADAVVSRSRISLAPAGTATGPWGFGVVVEGNGSHLRLEDSEVLTSQKTSYGVRALAGAQVELESGLIDTRGDYSAGLSAGSATVVARNLTVRTSGNDNAMGVVADAGSTVSLYGGTVTTSGNGSPVAGNLTFPHALVSRNEGAQLNAFGTSLRTTGQQAYGAAVDDGGSMLLENLSVSTEGQYSTGLYAGIGSLKPGAVSLTGRNLSVCTLGDAATAALVSRNGQAAEATLDLSDSSLSTSGRLSHGLQAEGGARLNASNTSVVTQGESSLGALANNRSSVQLDHASLDASGDLGHAAVTKNGGQLQASSSTLSASGQQTAALYAQGTEALESVANIDASVLRNQSGATLGVAGVATINLNDSTVGGSGQWLNVDQALASDGSSVPDMGTGQWQGVGKTLESPGRANLDVAGSILYGSARTASGSSSQVTLRDSSLWNMTGDSNLSQLSNLASVIDFSAPLAGGFKTLTVNSYHGSNGTIGLNTYLYTDGSASDKVVIDGGSASGSSNLLITNAGGPGAITQGNGILVVDAVNGAVTDRTAFRLLQRVVAGPYEYSLYRGSRDDSNGEAWYLRSTVEAVPDKPQVPDTPKSPDTPQVPDTPKSPDTPQIPDTPQVPDVPQGPRAPQVPHYRPETSLYRALPSMLINYSHAMVDTLHERVGEERRLDSEPLPSAVEDTYGPSLGWGRLIYRKGQDDLGEGARTDYRIHAFQVGSDLYRNEDTDGSTDQAGLSLNVGRISANVEHNDGSQAGDDLLRAYGIGGYWSHFGPEGWYLDGVLQFNRFDIKANSNELAGLKTRGRGVTASLEGGYPFQVNRDRDLHIEPQVQVVLSKLDVDDSRDPGAEVRFEDVDSLIGRLGVRIDKAWLRQDDKGKIQRTSAWVRPSVWHEFKGKSKTEFSSANGYIPFGTDMSGNWGELNLGLDYQVDERTTITGSLGVQKAMKA